MAKQIDGQGKFAIGNMNSRKPAKGFREIVLKVNGPAELDGGFGRAILAREELAQLKVGESIVRNDFQKLAQSPFGGGDFRWGRVQGRAAHAEIIGVRVGSSSTKCAFIGDFKG